MCLDEPVEVHEESGRIITEPARRKEYDHRGVKKVANAVQPCRSTKAASIVIRRVSYGSFTSHKAVSSAPSTNVIRMCASR
jgi:hypothetical protein